VGHFFKKCSTKQGRRTYAGIVPGTNSAPFAIGVVGHSFFSILDI